MTAKRFVVAYLGLAVFAPALASAQEPATTPLSAARERVAKGGQLFAQAEKKHDRALYEAAYLQFAQAYAIFPDPRVLWNLGMSEIRTERFVEGLAHLRAFDAHEHVLAQPTHPLNSMLAELLQQGNAATGHLAVEAPSGSTVSVDGKNVDHPAPLADPIDVLPGSHVIAAHEGDKSASMTVTAIAGVTSGVRLSFPRAPQVVTALPVPAVTAPSAPAPADAEEVPDTKRSPTSGARTTVAVSALGVAAVGLGVGIGFGLAARSKGNDLTTFQMAHPGSCANTASATCSSLSDDGKRDSTLSTVGFVVAGVGVAAAAAFWFLWPASSTRSAWILPSVGATSGGLQLGGSF
jgi:hypothetical protein